MKFSIFYSIYLVYCIPNAICMGEAILDQWMNEYDDDMGLHE